MALFVQQSGEASRCLSPATRDELSGQADYVLHGNDGRALAAEAKCICVDVSKGRQQAKRCADNIEKQRGCRPVIFLINGLIRASVPGSIRSESAPPSAASVIRKNGSTCCACAAIQISPSAHAPAEGLFVCVTVPRGNRADPGMPGADSHACCGCW